MIYRFENCELDTERREFRRDGSLRPIEPQVFDLLKFLIENRKRVVSRDEIFQAIWRGRFVSDGALATRINAVRALIGDSGAEQRLIRTLPRQGLRFVGAVDGGRNREKPGTVPRFPSHRLALTLNDVPTIAVTSLDCLSEEPRTRLLAAAITDEVVEALWTLGWLLVVSKEVVAVAPTSGKFECASNRLAARYLLRGSVRLVDDRIRIAVRLIEPASGRHLWAQSYNHAGADSDSIPELAAEEIKSRIASELFATESLRGRLKSAEGQSSWTAMVAALSLINTRQKRQVDAAYSLLRRAVAADPKCAPAYALLSFVTTLRVHLGWRSRTVSAGQAIDLARRAIALNGDDPWPHLALGYATLQTRNRPEEAIEILQHALALDPNFSMAHYLTALSSAYVGKTDQAFAHADMAERLQDYDLLARGNAGAHDIVRGTTSFVAGRYRDGITFARRAIAKNPRQAPAYRQLVTNAAFAGETEQAAAALRTLNRLSSDSGQFIRESATIWSQRAAYEKYVDAFRVAGLK